MRRSGRNFQRLTWLEVEARTIYLNDSVPLQNVKELARV